MTPYGYEDAHQIAGKASADLGRYSRAMPMEHGWRLCLEIEKEWGLEGYTPEMVSDILYRIMTGEEPGAAEDAVFYVEERANE